MAMMTYEGNDLVQGQVRQVEPASLATHGFLFADLRGYTAYLDRRGAAAGAALLQRFRGLVRIAVSAHNGAEIRTEGDSFYVVFPSASTAVTCALAIVRAAGGEVVGDDDRILVGVGVHAGEALETPEGPVGMAVNIAARLCAIARPGEVIVSDTVRALTRSVGSAAFVSLGRRAVKGLDEPLTVYRAVPAGTTDPGQRVHRPFSRLALVAVGLAVAGLVVLIVLPRLSIPEITPTGSLPATSSGAPAGSATASRPDDFLTTSTSDTCRTRDECGVPFAVPFAISLGSNWLLRGEEADLVVFEHLADPSGYIEAMLVAATLDPPCPATTPKFIGESPGDVIDWLSSRQWLNHGDPRPYNIGSHLGRSVDVEVPSGDRWTCGGPQKAGTAHMFRLGGDASQGSFGSFWRGVTGERYRVIAIEVQGQTVVFTVGRSADAEAFWRLSAPLLQTIEFAEPAS